MMSCCNSSRSDIFDESIERGVGSEPRLLPPFSVSFPRSDYRATRWTSFLVARDLPEADHWPAHGANTGLRIVWQSADAERGIPIDLAPDLVSSQHGRNGFLELRAE